MVVFLRNGMPKLLLVVVLSLFVVVIYQLCYANDFALTGDLSETIRIINGCPPDTLEPLYNFHRINDSGIPNTVHQLWKTADVRNYSKELKASRKSWRTMLEVRNYTIKLWTDDDVLELIKTKYDWLLPTYRNYPHNIQRADIARLLIVHHEGGIYADLDVHPNPAEGIRCLQNLGLQAIFSPTGSTLGLSNHFFMAERGSPFLEWALCEAKRRGGTSGRIVLPYLRVFWSTGPIMLTAAFREFAWVYGSMWHSIGLLDEGYSGELIRHEAGRSWQGLDGRALNYIADHVPVKGLIMGFACLFTVLVFVYVRRRHHRSILFRIWNKFRMKPD